MWKACRQESLDQEHGQIEPDGGVSVDRRTWSYVANQLHHCQLQQARAVPQPLGLDPWTRHRRYHGTVRQDRQAVIISASNGHNIA